MAVLQRAPAPLSTAISDVDKNGRFTGYVPTPWSDYFNGLDNQIAQSFVVLQTQSVAAGSAAIGVTPISGDILSAGLYRVSYYLVELQADNVGSSVTVSISWTDSGSTITPTTRTLSGAAVTANSVNAVQTNTYLLRIDRATPITYAVAYSSTGGTPKMIYSLVVSLEQVLRS
jgi:hypothetical protein